MALFLCGGFLFRLNFVPSGSMEPTIEAGDVILSRAFGLDKIRKNDIIIFYSHNERNDLFIKRVAGLPGDHLVITENEVVINGKVVCDENPVKYSNDLNIGEYIIPEGQYFVMGDNRNNSYDGRYLDNVFIKEVDIKTVGMVVVCPLSHISILE